MTEPCFGGNRHTLSSCAWLCPLGLHRRGSDFLLGAVSQSVLGTAETLPRGSGSSHMPLCPLVPEVVALGLEFALASVIL